MREFNCLGGIVITAAHNPKQYNGYKVYGTYSGQITDETAKKIIGYINKLHIFDYVKTMDEKEALDKELLSYIGEEIDKEYIKNVKVVKEQESPDGNFLIASYPNLEDKSVFKLDLEMDKLENQDIIFGMDHDCYRIGFVVKDNSGDYKVLNGNQTRRLLANYILKSLKDEGGLSLKVAIIKTIVTTEGVKNIADFYWAELINTLTRFKYIGEKIGAFENNKSNDFIFDLEGSY